MVSAARLLDAAAPAVAGDYQQFVLDLAELTFTDCCGARALEVLVRAVPDECALVVRSVQPAVRRLLDFTGIVLERMPRQEPVTAALRSPYRSAMMGGSQEIAGGAIYAPAPVA